ncbi:MAG TPA: tetratricopeptide repeat protein [Longimicrobiales bacterium]|nr:tetratricopeptide repeat protein [Longimicrobiales bacterium]
MASIKERLRTSHVGHWALAYVGAAWLALQVVDILADQFRWPLRLQQSITVLLMAGFFVTVVLAWYHGEKGRQRFGATEVLAVAALLLVAAGVLAVLRPVDGGDTPPVPWLSRRAAPVTVVAVLPFHNLGGDPRDDPLADGLHEDILTQLSGIGALTVISRQSVLRYAGEDRDLPRIAAELGAGSLLEGSVRREGNRVRVTVQLIDAVTDAHVWAETYDRTMTEALAIQSEVAREVAAALEATLSPAESRRLARMPTTGPGAWERVQEARMVRDRGDGGWESVAHEERVLREALDRDPAYALAWALLSANFARRSWDLGMGAAWEDSALTAARRAIELEPELALGHHALGGAYNTQGFLDGAEEAYRAALLLDPNLAEAYVELGRIAAVRGRYVDAIGLLEDALRRDPHMPGIRTQLGHCFAALDELDEAGRWFASEVDVRETAGLPTAEIEAWAHWWAGDLGAAEAAAARAAAARPEDGVAQAGLAELRLVRGDAAGAARAARTALEHTPEAGRVAYLLFASTTLGTALVQLGDSAAAREQFEASRTALAREVEHRDQYPLTYLELAVVEDAIGHRSDALAWARRAFEMGSRHLRLIESYPAFQGLRGDPDFQRIVARMEADVGRMRRAVARRAP